ncbi:rho GTPase-activating protein conundrum-like isoform X1 [Zophobas morio]|uniref:rho GTPase-activating protein conundrum-like isoform X1 n=1 Tax=Zophobas morio TaxID=2755281 RepID=UPI003083BE3F
MESEEALNYYINEVKDTNNEIEIEEEHVPNEAEQATDFLQKVGLSDLTKLYSQGKEITENVINDSVRQKNLTERQAETVKSRIRTLNRTLHSRQPRRKQRQDIRDVTWNVETSSTGTRSRSATPDSLDSVGILNDDLTSDDDQQLSSLPPFPLESSHSVFKAKVKWTSSEPIQNKKFNRNDKGDVAHLGSENVILKGYQPLNEYSTLPRPQRERSGSDPTTEVHLQPLKNRNGDNFELKPLKLSNELSRSQNSFEISNNANNCSRVYITGDENEILSFEGLMKQNKVSQLTSQNLDSCDEGVDIDEFTDSEYQYLKPLLYVELVAIFDQHKVVFLKRKASTKYKGGNVFGVNLSTLVMRDMQRPTDNFMVPNIFQSVVSQLNTRCISEDGILRLAGQKQKLEFLCNEIESKFFTNRQDVESLLQQATVHELTGVLKKLLRDLPDPVFTMELFDMFYKTSLIPNNEDKLKALNLLVLLLPIEHRNTYKLLLQFLLNVIKHEKENRMNLHNVAMITAPSFFPARLLLPKDNSGKLIQLTKEELTKRINGAAVCCVIMETMLRAGLKLWLIPPSLARQAKEAQKRAQDKKDGSRDRDKRIPCGKTKLVRSSTQYEPGPINSPRIKKEFYI